MPMRIELDALQELLADGGQLVDVLARAEYAEEHLPSAVNIPIKELDAATTGQLDRGRPVIVYCHDGL
jgi:rhodanese-related sulfurtransferase